MAKIKGLRLSPRLEAELDFVVQELGDLATICGRCDARLNNYADKCTADLSDCCPGYLAIENTKEKFNKLTVTAKWVNPPADKEGK